MTVGIAGECIDTRAEHGSPAGGRGRDHQCNQRRTRDCSMTRLDGESEAHAEQEGNRKPWWPEPSSALTADSGRRATVFPAGSDHPCHKHAGDHEYDTASDHETVDADARVRVDIPHRTYG